ncbi:hypothetical protein AVO46_18055 [Vibrio cholerae]|nr:hypothetical protein AVO46_18055 [Vibrio cholerae]
MVPEERWQLVDVRVRVRVPVVSGKKGLQRPGVLALGGEAAGGVLEGEVQDGLHLVPGCVLGGEALGGVEDSPNMKNSSLPWALA